MNDVVFSRRQVERFAPPGSPRVYLIQPLAFRARQAYRAELATEGGLYPSQDALMEGIRGALCEIAPANLAELLAEVDAAAAEAKAREEAAGNGAEPAGPEDHALLRKLGALEAIASAVPVYAALLAARTRYMGMLPLVAARHALRGWEGPQLPPFAAERGLVSYDLLELIPDGELEAVGWRAAALMAPSRAAAGNSEGRSPPPVIPEPIAAE